jgi:prepilin-type N-terminal cleavage/methylation domain-containing protein
LNKGFSPASKSSLKSFTLLELIVVIVILGILATLGYSQYTKMVEKMRISEAVATIGSIRQLVYQYWLGRGDLSAITNADVGIGSSSDQIPDSCRSTNYFYYSLAQQNPTWVEINADRCTSGGKSPNYTSGNRYDIYIHYYPSTGSGDLRCWDRIAGQDISWCVP